MSGQVVGYARTSTLDQVAGFEAQIAELKEAGVTKLFTEQVSSVSERPQLEAALEYLREGDTLIVSKLDRLARSVRHLGEIVELLDEKKVSLKILNIALDTATSTGKLMLNVLGSVAQFEREMMLERQKEGIVKAMAEGRYKGRPKTHDSAEVKRLIAEGTKVKEIQKQLGISRASIYRLMKA